MWTANVLDNTNIGRFYKFNFSLASSKNLNKATANVILFSTNLAKLSLIFAQIPIFFRGQLEY